MPGENLAETVSNARLLLKDWGEKKTVDELVVAIRRSLEPLAGKVAELPASAREKLAEINSSLDQLTGRMFTVEQRDALDMLMLGLWIRIELFADPEED